LEFDLKTVASPLLFWSLDILLSFLLVVGLLREPLCSLLLCDVIVSPVRLVIGGLALMSTPELAIVLARLCILAFSLPPEVLLFSIPVLSDGYELIV